MKLLEDSLKHPSRFKQFKKLFDESRGLNDFKKFFSQKVKPGLKYNSYIGNCYNASIFISMLGALEKSKKNQDILFLGYGSGAGSLVLKGKTLKDNFKSDLSQQIKNGKELTSVQYRQWKKDLVKKIQNL